MPSPDFTSKHRPRPIKTEATMADKTPCRLYRLQSQRFYTQRRQDFRRLNRRIRQRRKTLRSTQRLRTMVTLIPSNRSPTYLSLEITQPPHHFYTKSSSETCSDQARRRHGSFSRVAVRRRIAPSRPDWVLTYCPPTYTETPSRSIPESLTNN